MKSIPSNWRTIIFLMSTFFVGIFAYFEITSFSSQNEGSNKVVIQDDYLQKEDISSERAPAADATFKPPFVVDKGEKKLVINLRYICSNWLWLDDPGVFGNPSNQERYCSDTAYVSTAMANEIFRNSKLPVKFTFSIVEQATYDKRLTGSFGSLAEMNKLIAESNTPFETITQNAANSLQEIIPMYRIKSLEGLYTTSAVSLVVNKNVRINIPTNSQGYLPVTVRCTNPDSTAQINNFEKTWGVNLDTFRRAPRSQLGTAAGSVPCGTCPSDKFGIAPALGFSSLTSPFSDNFVCRIYCPCMHAYATGGWAEYGYYNDATGAIKTTPPGGCGPYPGLASDPSGYNDCGYQITNSQPIYTFKPNAKLLNPIATGLTVMQSDEEALKWLANSRYVPGINSYELLVAVRPDGQRAGKAYALVDKSFNAIVYEHNQSKVEVLPPKEQFFKKAIGVLLNNRPGLNDTVAHEIGHILSGWHELESVPETDPTFYFWNRDELKKRKVGAYLFDDPNIALPWGTIMKSLANNSVPYFSTSEFKGNVSVFHVGANVKEYSLHGGFHENRTHILYLLEYLAGEELDMVRKRKREAAIKVVADMVKKANQKK